MIFPRVLPLVLGTLRGQPNPRGGSTTVTVPSDKPGRPGVFDRFATATAT